MDWEFQSDPHHKASDDLKYRVQDIPLWLLLDISTSYSGLEHELMNDFQLGWAMPLSKQYGIHVYELYVWF